MNREKETLDQGSAIAGAVNADMNMAAAQTHMDKLCAQQGHGFAAEQANNLCDLLLGREAAIVGGDNAKNGADRLVNGVFIQTKYCQNATSSVAAAFEEGRYRYLNANGSLMQLEVPLDQYEDAVELIAQRIKSGQVPGIKDPAEAKAIVRKGHFTYTQAKNIAKFGTVESLAYDATTGAIISTSALGVTAVLTFAKSLWEGAELDTAVENAVVSGVQIGGAAFVNTLITSQLMRTGLNKALTAPTEAVVELIGPKVSAGIANSLRSGANIYGAAAMKNAAKLLRGNIVTSVVMTVVLSAKDIGNAFRGRISGKQLFKNLMTIAGGMAGGTAGGLAGGYALSFIPGAGPVLAFAIPAIGAMAGGAAGGAAVSTAVGKFVEDDAVALVKLLEETFCQLAQEYVLSQEEVAIVVDDLHTALSGEALLDMYASGDHAAYADDLLRGLIERLIRGRCRICLPGEDVFLHGFGTWMADEMKGIPCFGSGAAKTVDPVRIGQALTGREISPHAAKKAWYATKQMNLAQMQPEMLMKKMLRDEQTLRQDLAGIHQEREAIKNEIQNLLGGTKNDNSIDTCAAFDLE